MRHYLGRVTRTAFQANSISQCDMWCRDIESELRRAMLAQFNRPGKNPIRQPIRYHYFPSSRFSSTRLHQSIKVLKIDWWITHNGTISFHSYHPIILKHRPKASPKSLLVLSQSQSVLVNHSNSEHKLKVNQLPWSNGWKVKSNT